MKRIIWLFLRATIPCSFFDVYCFFLTELSASSYAIITVLLPCHAHIVQFPCFSTKLISFNTTLYWQTSVLLFSTSSYFITFTTISFPRFTLTIDFRKSATTFRAKFDKNILLHVALDDRRRFAGFTRFSSVEASYNWTFQWRFHVICLNRGPILGIIVVEATITEKAYLPVQYRFEILRSSMDKVPESLADESKKYLWCVELSNRKRIGTESREPALENGIRGRP